MGASGWRQQKREKDKTSGLKTLAKKTKVKSLKPNETRRGERKRKKNSKKKNKSPGFNKQEQRSALHIPSTFIDGETTVAYHFIEAHIIAPRSTGRAEIKGGDIVDQNLDMMGHLFLHEVAFEHPASQAKSYTLLSRMEKATEGVSLNEGSVDPKVLW